MRYCGQSRKTTPGLNPSAQLRRCEVPDPYTALTLSQIWRPTMRRHASLISRIAPDSRGFHSQPNASITAFMVRAASSEAYSGQPSQSTSYLRTAHSVARLEIASCVGDDLAPGRMIRCLDAGDFGFEAAVILVHELEKFKLR